MRYLVIARLKSGQSEALRHAIAARTLGRGSVAGAEYMRNMRMARLLDDGSVRWIEVCYCHEPLDEERAYWEPYFDLVEIKDAHARANCRHENGTEHWACGGCDCTLKLESHLATRGESFLTKLTTELPHADSARPVH